jgi:hypothetical protein
MAARKDCYTDKEKSKIVAHVLAELSAGIPVSKTLGANKAKWLCSERCFWNWYHDCDPEDEASLVQKVARARDSGIEARIERALEISETPMMGEIRINKHINIGGAAVPVVEVRHEDMLGHRKLMVDTALKAAQMLKPKKYGAKVDVTSDGQPIGELDDTARAIRLAAVLSAAPRRDDA